MLRFFFLFWVACAHLFSLDFHDFDPYQGKLTAEQVYDKIERFLEKDPSIRKFYNLTPQALYIGDLEQEQVDYVLYLAPVSSPSARPRKPRWKNLKIAIDPGHFGGELAQLEERYIAIDAQHTFNNQPISFCEGDLTYLTALALQRLLEAQGITTLITRNGIGQGAIQEDFFTWRETHPDCKKEDSLSKAFRKYYNTEDLIQRAKKINDFSPDLTIVIHYNTHLTAQEKEEKAVLTQTNYNLAFIPGAFCEGELQKESARYEFLRLLVTDDLEKSVQLSDCITKQFAKILEVPLIAAEEKTSYTTTVCLLQQPGIYSRNLVLTRMVHGPVCYGETLIQNNLEEVYRLSQSDTSIAGIACSKRLEEVAKAYFEGIKEYYSLLP